MTTTTISASDGLVYRRAVGISITLVVSLVAFSFVFPVHNLFSRTDASPFGRRALRTHEPLHFFIAGFEKCGTTFMLNSFDQHKETSIVPHEQCFIGNTRHPDEEVYNALQADLRPFPPHIKRGIKCPRGLSPTSLRRLEQWYPHTKILLALRHPVDYFRSFYNFRVAMVYQGNKHTENNTIPPPETLLGSNEWLKVSTDNARFEYDLRKLGKTPNQVGDKMFKPTKFKVLLYSLDQVSDKDIERREDFGKHVANWLGLKEPLRTGPRLKAGPQHTKDEFKESFDICKEQYSGLRNLLIEQGKETVRWIREEFLASRDVTVVNPDHFLETLETWAVDPCSESLE